MPDRTQVLPVLVRVHAHDPGCTADDCAHKAVLDTVVQYGAPKVAPALRTMTQPPGGITLERAIDAADTYVAHASLDYGPLVLVSAEAGPRALVDENGSASKLGWVWALRYVSEDGLTNVSVYVG